MPKGSSAGLNNKWFWAAAVIAALASFTVVSELKGSAFRTANPPSAGVIDATLTQVVNQLKPNLPKKIDEVTTLIDVWHNGKQITYLYEVNLRGRQIPSNFTAIARNEVVPKVCGSDMKGGIVSYGITYVYRYNLPNGSRVGEFAVTASDCT
jgi:hypothetical protein